MQKIRIEDKISDYHINNRDIRNIENLKQCILPEDYKEFLLKYNGGSPNFDAFEIKDYFSDGRSSFDSIRYFFGICHDKKSIMRGYDILNKIESSKNRIPIELLPIACDPLGNIVCIGIKGKYYKKIYFWDHENEAGSRDPFDNTIKPWWKNITIIASSFSDLLNSLCQYELGDNNESILTYQDGSVRRSSNP